MSTSKLRDGQSINYPDLTTVKAERPLSSWPEQAAIPTLSDWDIVASHLGVMLAFEWDRPARARDPALLTHHTGESWITVLCARGEPLLLLRQESAESFASAISMLRAARVVIVADCVTQGVDTLRIREVHVSIHATAPGTTPPSDD